MYATTKWNPKTGRYHPMIVIGTNSYVSEMQYVNSVDASVQAQRDFECYKSIMIKSAIYNRYLPQAKPTES